MMVPPLAPYSDTYPRRPNHVADADVVLTSQIATREKGNWVAMCNEDCTHPQAL
jgi:hypothetical protein